MPDRNDSWQHEVDRRMALAREWDELVEQVRALPSFEDFLRPPRLETLLPAAKGGPVVVVNVSQWRCDALVVRTGGVEPIELPNLTLQAVANRTDEYLKAVQAFQGETATYCKAVVVWEESDKENAALLARARALTHFAQAREKLEHILNGTTRWMWDEFAEKILDRLGYRSVPEADTWPRIWWCPTGPLTLLPLHAAGYHDSGTDAVLDRVVSSYTPTLRALLQARGDDLQTRDTVLEDDPASARMFFVGLDKTPGQSDLPNVKYERDLLASLFPGDRSTVLSESESTRAKVLEGLAGHRWVHFSCHGEQNLTDPSHGGLYLRDGMLTIADVSTRQHTGDFAFLGACKTATGGVDLPDEAITLAAALHYTGYRHVIATLWSVVDEYAHQVTKSVYRSLVKDAVLDSDRAAWALHDAVRTLREGHRGKPSVWTPFTHTGP